MSKSNQPDQKNLAQPDLPCLIQLDEGMFGSRIVERISPDMLPDRLHHSLDKLERFHLAIAPDEDWDEEEYKYENLNQEFEPKVISIFSHKKFK